MYRFIMILWVSLFVFCGVVVAQSPKDIVPDSSWIRKTEIIRHTIERTEDIETFGKDIVREVLTRAIGLPQGEIPQPPDPIEIVIKFKVKVFEIPDVPTPEEVDICWEICPSSQGGSFLDCYINCAGPGFSAEPIIIRTCDDVREDLMAATGLLERMTYLRELIKMGCLKPEKVKLEIPLNR